MCLTLVLRQSGGGVVEVGILTIRLAKRTDRGAKEKDDRRETCSITLDLLELLGMVVTTRVVLEIVRDRGIRCWCVVTTRQQYVGSLDAGGGGTNEHAS